MRSGVHLVWALAALLVPALTVAACGDRGKPAAPRVPALPKAPATTHAPAPAPAGPAVTYTESRSDAVAEASKLRVRVAAQDAEIADLRARLAAFDGVDPAAAIVNNDRDVGRKIRALAKLPEGRRTSAAVDLGRLLMMRPDRGDEVLAALQNEDDPAALRVLAETIRSGGLASVPATARAAAIEALRSGEPAERRLAAARALAPGAEPTPPAAFDAVVERLRVEESAPVLGALADLVGPRPSPAALEALEWAARRMPPCAERRRVLVPVARAGISRDRGEKLYARAEEATSPDLRDDLAAAMAAAGNAMSAAIVQAEPEEQRVERTRREHERFLHLYALVTDPAVRIELVRAAAGGLSVLSPVGPTPEERAAFYRTVASVEADADLKVRLERVAKGCADGSLTATSPALDAILTGRR